MRRARQTALPLSIDAPVPQVVVPSSETPKVKRRGARDVEMLKFLIDFLTEPDEDGELVMFDEWDEPTRDSLLLIRDLAKADALLADSDDGRLIVYGSVAQALLKNDSEFAALSGRMDAIGEPFWDLVDTCLNYADNAN